MLGPDSRRLSNLIEPSEEGAVRARTGGRRGGAMAPARHSPKRVQRRAQQLQERQREEAEKRREEIARTTDGFSDWLGLSASQQVQFQTVWEQRALRESEIRALEKSGTVSRDEITTRRQTLNATVREDVASFLDQEQLRTLMSKFGSKEERAAAKKGG